MSNETIFREVDEELRGDRLRALWRRYGPFVIGGAIAIVLVVAVNEGWAWWQNSNAARSSDQFYAALELAESGDVAAAQEALNAVVAQGTAAIHARALPAGLAPRARAGRLKPSPPTTRSPPPRPTRACATWPSSSPPIC